MSTRRRTSSGLVAAAGLVFALAPAASAAVFTAAGANPAAIQASVDGLRAALGANNGVGGTFATGRREINWDGVPNGFAAPNPLPANFFNVNSPRGVVFSTAGTGFQVSASAASGTPVRFGNLNAAYPADNQTFSAERLFTALGSNTLQIDFFVPGTSIPATVAGFGAVFTDAEVAAAARYTVFLGDGTNGGQFGVPVAPTGGLSFLGLTDPLRYSRIVIQSGTAVPGASESLNAVDVVFMDDFIYGEPQAIQAIPTLTTQASGPVAVGGAISATATLAGGANPTGSITFLLFDPNNPTCTGTPTATFGPVLVAGNGVYASGQFTTNLVGTWRWIANYSGDVGNAAVNGACDGLNQNVEVRSILEVPAVSTLGLAALALCTAALAVSRLRRRA